MTPLPPAVQTRLERLPLALREHIERVRQEAACLAQHYGLDLSRVDLAAAAHDLARALDGPALLAEAQRYGARVHPVERSEPVLLHGRVAGLWLQKEDGIGDQDVLQAVTWHTTGRKGMGPVAKVVFLADKMEPAKSSRYPYIEEIRALATQSLDKALLSFLDHQLEDFVQRGWLIHPATLGLRNELMLTMGAVRD